MYKQLEPYIVVRDYRKYNLIDPVIKPEQMSLQALDWAIIDCYRSFYMGKLKEIVTMKDEFKRRYLLSSMKLIMSSSFIVDKLGSLGTMPPEVKTLIRKIEAEKMTSPKAAGKPRSGVVESVRIHAPVEKVFAYVTDPANWTNYVTSLVSVRDCSGPAPEAGMTFAWTYRMLGINFNGTGTVTTFRKNRAFGMSMHGAFPVEESFRFEKDGGTTVLTVAIDYEVPGKVLGVIANRLVVEKVNRKEAQAVLKKIKAICEAEKI
jgi:uncharacterized membrane protein